MLLVLQRSVQAYDSWHGKVASRHERHPVGVREAYKAYYILRPLSVHRIVDNLSSVYTLQLLRTHGGSSSPWRSSP